MDLGQFLVLVMCIALTVGLWWGVVLIKGALVNLWFQILLYFRELFGMEPISQENPRNVKGDYISIKSTFETNDYRTPFSHAENTGAQKPKGKSSAKWVPFSEAFNVRDLEIPNGLVYLGKNLESVDRYYVEPSLIDPSLKVDFKSPDWSGDDMGYFPSYSEISPKCRGAYLTWLSEGRRNPEIGVGYIFIFFYGLERRVLHDECKNEELKEIVEEVTALLKCYGSKSRSIKQYFTNFLSFVAVQYGAEFHSSSLGEGELYARYFTPLFLQQLGTTVKQGDPISKELALVWVKQHPDIRLPTPARRCPSEFHVLYMHHYQEIYGEGFLVKENKTRLDLSYLPSSAGIYQIHKKIDLPDPSQLSGPLKKLMKVVDVCIAELDPYSRFLGRKGDPESIEAKMLLPPLLRDEITLPGLEDFEAQLSDAAKLGKLISVPELVNLMGDHAPKEWKKKDAIIMAQMAESCGFGLVPDVRFHKLSVSHIDQFAVFEGGYESGFTLRDECTQMMDRLKLGAMIADSDGTVEAEKKLLGQQIEANRLLDSTEKKSLTAYMHWELGSNKRSLTGIKSKVQLMDERGRLALRELILEVALADNKVTPEEIRQLEKVYKALGFDPATVKTDVFDASGQGVRKTVAPTDSKSIAAEKAKSISIDPDRLAALEKDTAVAKEVLSQIFVDDQDDDEPEELEAEETEVVPEGLDEKHLALYQKLIEYEEWTQADIAALCESYGLMLDGAVEVINEWSFDKYDEMLIELGEPTYINIDLSEND